jgi:tight adherence protein B
MFGQIAVMSITFATVSAGIAALALLLRDLFAKPADQGRPRLEFAEAAPEGDFDRSFFLMIEQTGLGLDLPAAMAVVLGGAVIGGGACFVFSENLLATAGGIVLGGLLPILYFAVVRWWRLRGMQNQLPQALQAVSDAIRSGQTLSEACELVSKEIKGPLGQEFHYAHSQLELGHAPLAVMARMVGRVPLTEFRIFATAVTVHRRAGGNLSLLSERMSRAARDRQDVRSHLMAVTSGGRLSAIGMVLGTVVAAALLFWVQPDYITAFFRNPKGPWLLAIALGLQVTGALWVWRILRTSY